MREDLQESGISPGINDSQREGSGKRSRQRGRHWSRGAIVHGGWLRVKKGE